MELTPAAAPDAYNHGPYYQRSAAFLREHPHEWFELDLRAPTTYVNRGNLAAFRPAGHFEAAQRGGVFLARYIGPPDA
jgi:hypothetical protein